jgi:hypothetical protein
MNFKGAPGIPTVPPMPPQPPTLSLFGAPPTTTTTPQAPSFGLAGTPTTTASAGTSSAAPSTTSTTTSIFAAPPPPPPPGHFSGLSGMFGSYINTPTIPNNSNHNAAPMTTTPSFPSTSSFFPTHSANASFFSPHSSSRNLSRLRSTTSPFSKKQPLQPGDFGYDTYINYPKSEGPPLVAGFPPSKPLWETIEEETAQQEALLHLCLLAETTCWRKLFNAAIDAYVQGELGLHRNIPFEHIDLIYEHTHPESPLRRFAVDSVRRLNNPQTDYKVYLPLAQDHEDFLDNLMQNLSISNLREGQRYLGIKYKKNYHMAADPSQAPDEPKNVFARKGKEKQNTNGADNNSPTSQNSGHTSSLSD